MKHLVNKARDIITVDFMGDTVQVAAMSLSEIQSFRGLLKKLNEDKKLSDEDRVLAMNRTLIRKSVVDAEGLSDSELDSFPPKALRGLAQAIMEHNDLVATPDEPVDAEGNAPTA